MKRTHTKLLPLIAALISVGSIYFMNGCGHKAKLHAPPPRRPEQISHFGAYLFCGKVQLFWSPIFFDTRGDPLQEPVRYLIFRKRNDLVEITSFTATPSPTAVAGELSSSTQEVPETEKAVPGNVLPETTPTPGVFSMNPENVAPAPSVSPTPSATPTHIPPDYDYKLIGIIEGGEPLLTSDERNTKEFTFDDEGLPGVYLSLSDRFRKPKDFPPEKTDDDLDLLPGYEYSYRIQAVNAKGFTSEPSYDLHFPYIYIPSAPSDFKAEVKERSIILTWLPPETDCKGAVLNYDILGYHIERSDTEDADHFEGLATLDASEGTSYTDTSVSIDREYFYRIRGWVDAIQIPGEFSEVLKVDTTDRFPPSKPTGLRAAAALKGIHLIWNANPENDIAGYRIYRATGETGAFKQITDSLVIRNYFTDDKVVSGQFYRYRIIAVDESKRQNASEPSEIVRVIYP